jgi:hypothetical protein
LTEIDRCPGCGGRCDGLYQRTVTEILFSERTTPRGHEDKKHLLRLQVREIGKCALTVEQVDDNIDGLVGGTRVLNG